MPEPRPAPVVLVGQAPGRVELVRRRPFSGRAGGQLFRWLARAGCRSEADARARIYVTSITKCYPGPALAGAGDRRPSSAEVACCRPFLDRQLELLRPRVVIAVGGLAQARFLSPRPLAELVGRCFDAAGGEVPVLPARDPATGPPAGRPVAHEAPRPWVVPLPHPSGASRWLNRAEHAALLDRALAILAVLLGVEMERAAAGAGPAR